MKKLKQNFYEELLDILDEQFPKGKCKERGAGLVFFAKAFKMFDILVKAFGGCDKCFGKGYGTQTIGITEHADFLGDKTRHYKGPTIVFCSCPRGKQLKELLK